MQKQALHRAYLLLEPLSAVAPASAALCTVQMPAASLTAAGVGPAGTAETRVPNPAADTVRHMPAGGAAVCSEAAVGGDAAAAVAAMSGAAASGEGASGDAEGVPLEPVAAFDGSRRIAGLPAAEAVGGVSWNSMRLVFQARSLTIAREI